MSCGLWLLVNGTGKCLVCESQYSNSNWWCNYNGLYESMDNYTMGTLLCTAIQWGLWV